SAFLVQPRRILGATSRSAIHYSNRKALRKVIDCSRLCARFRGNTRVGGYYSDPLSSWIPTGERQESANSLPRQPVWLPSVPLFSKWQNSTCDCLDVLHWQANANIGQHSGLEHPTVFHLYLARIVLLAPCESLSGLPSTGRVPMTSIEQQMRGMRSRSSVHQYKARLAVVHAAVLFWHVRHHSVDVF
ncbi:hypothetical protein BDV96DRAFT_678028, partial [Lophiotrema nucula]